MKPDFSEFSYGYAVTEELVATNVAKVVAAPTFPSLYEEGQSGGGYDVKVPLVGAPIFLQFKLSDCLQSAQAKEFKEGYLSIPYYRMHLRPLKHSKQHTLLRELEAAGETVLYIAPEFHLPDDLNAHYLARKVIANSAAFKPSDIALPDSDEHYMVFERGTSFGYLCSDNPAPVPKSNFLKELLAGARPEERRLGPEGLRELSTKMLFALEAPVGRARIGLLREIVETRDPIESAGYLARTFFDCELVIAKAREQPSDGTKD